jgi:hypothetical protein
MQQLRYCVLHPLIGRYAQLISYVFGSLVYSLLWFITQRGKDMIQTLMDAIDERLEIRFTYSGYDRVAQPAAIGESRKGNVVLRCYQTEGGHVTPGHEWDLCIVDDISSLTVTNDVFEDNPPGYKKGDKHMREIYAEL